MRDDERFAPEAGRTRLVAVAAVLVIATALAVWQLRPRRSERAHRHHRSAPSAVDTSEPAAAATPRTPPSPRVARLEISSARKAVLPLRAGAGIDELHIELALEAPLAKRYKARVLGPTGVVVWEGDDLSPAGRVLTLSVPAAALRPGEHRVEVGRPGAPAAAQRSYTFLLTATF